MRLGNAIRVLNLYAGIGGNRKLWPQDWQVTAIEDNERIAAIYQELYPNDAVLVEDAHIYLKHNYTNYDLIWSSPPCQTHSKSQRMHKRIDYVDPQLLQQIIFLKRFYKGIWFVENVEVDYEPPYNPKLVDRHLIWSNIELAARDEIRTPKNFKHMSKEDLSEFHSIYHTNINRQMLRNCVHPETGKYIIDHLFVMEDFFN